MTIESEWRERLDLETALVTLITTGVERVSVARDCLSNVGMSDELSAHEELACVAG